MNRATRSVSLDQLTTEAANPASANIDTLSTLEFVRLMNAEDATVPMALAKAEASIAKAIEVITDRIRSGGRLIYIGAGTSGRLGVLDASECPPTFNTPPEMVVGIIAGGDSALRKAAEGVEDHPEVGAADVKRINLTSNDVLVGIASSGRTPYVVGALNYARSINAFAIGLSCNEHSAIADFSDLMITLVVGPEIISGSTRMKAGTATKLALNMLTTGVMVQLGKTYGNLMVDVRATNSKLVARSRRIVAGLTQLSEDQAEAALSECNGELKTAVVTSRLRVDAETARQILRRCGGQLRLALQTPTESSESPTGSLP